MHRSSYDIGYSVREIQQQRNTSNKKSVRSTCTRSTYLGKRNSYGCSNDTPPDDSPEQQAAGQLRTNYLKLAGLQVHQVQEQPGSSCVASKRLCSTWGASTSRACAAELALQQQQSSENKPFQAPAPGHLVAIMETQATSIQQLSKDLMGLIAEVETLRDFSAGPSSSSRFVEHCTVAQQRIESVQHRGGEKVGPSSCFLQSQVFPPCLPTPKAPHKYDAKNHHDDAPNKATLSGAEQQFCDPINWDLSRSLHETLQHLITLTEKTIVERAMLLKAVNLTPPPKFVKQEEGQQHDIIRC
jgi:hypothetical protein